MEKFSKWKFYHRKFLVDPFQLRLAGVAVCHFLLVIMIFVTALYLPVIIELQSGDITAPHVQAAARKFLFLHNNLWLPLLGALALLVMHNILVSHRIAGPLYRLRRYLKGVGDGDLSTPIVFRKKDYLQKEADVASEMVESLSDKVRYVERQLERVSWAWSEMRSALVDGTVYDLQLKIDAMDDLIEGCRSSMDTLKTMDQPASSTLKDHHAPTSRREAVPSKKLEKVEV
jgi:methyl-accepting chemotaxis protein